jgi:2',3'-cyclic-nucleotide 2'-phosphodiesterase (5'-nucleotidase family)
VDESHGKRVPLSSQQYGKVSDFLRSHPPFEKVFEDKKALAVLQPYRDVVDKFSSEKVAHLKDDLLLAPFLSGSGESPPISQAATLVTKAFLWKLREQGFAVDGVIIPLAAVRKELLAGPLLVRDAYEVLPSGSTLVLVSIDKRDLTRLLEDAMANFRNFPQLFGLRMVVDMRKPVGSRISGIEIVRSGTPGPLGEFEKVRLAVPSDMLSGAAGYTMNGLSDLVDTDLVDNEVLLDYLLHEKDIAADTSINVEWIATTRT